MAPVAAEPLCVGLTLPGNGPLIFSGSDCRQKKQKSAPLLIIIRYGNKFFKVPTGMPMVPVESTVCVWVKVRGFGVVKENK